MLQAQFDEINSYVSRNHVASGDSSSLDSATEEINRNLVSRISALQELVTKQNSQLKELRKDRQLLLENNKIMKD